MSFFSVNETNIPFFVDRNIICKKLLPTWKVIFLVAKKNITM